MSVGLYTFRGKLIELALKRLATPKPTYVETMLCLQLGSDVLAEKLTREEAAALVRQHAADALVALLARGSGYPCSLVVCSPHSIAVDSLDGTVTQLIARQHGDGSMSVQVTFSDKTQEVALLKRRATD